jgi:hypothetical protein
MWCDCFGTGNIDKIDVALKYNGFPKSNGLFNVVELSQHETKLEMEQAS